MEIKFKPINFLLISNTICGLILLSWLLKRISSNGFVKLTRITKKKKKILEADNKRSLLDLPDLTLDCILEKLSPAQLCVMSCVCSELRDKCVSNHLWNKHMEKKWGKLMSDSVTKEWRQVSTTMAFLRKSNGNSNNKSYWKWLRINNGGDKKRLSSNSCDVTQNSVMFWYSNLENGKFWFPAQVYNRENGHVGFMMSCYDAKIRYDYKTDSFRARYSPHQGRRTAEENVTWERFRPCLVNTKSRDLHVSDCLHSLRPGDHVEIQWRRSKEFPYGWWYGIVGHLGNCDGEDNCRCYSDEKVVMEFRQFRPESPWRMTVIDRRGHRETGNEADGFYGGVRKLGSEEEISTWKRLWPPQVLE